MTKYNYVIFLLLIGFVLISGCTNESSTTTYQAPNSTFETTCSADEEICVLGTPGLVNQDGIYSGSNSFFSVILRNNVAGQEAKNVKVTLKNVGPFSIVEGVDCGQTNLRKPYEIRTLFNSPNPQFINDLGKPFATHNVGVMYPDEEIEFLWELASPSFQEIANVAYDHSFGYEVNYDYTTGVLQTVYVISEDEYQRILKNEGKEPDLKGTMTVSTGALSIKKELEEPVRLINEESQLPLKYEIHNKGRGIPNEPALFLLQYPEGVDYIGLFKGYDSLVNLGYIDLLGAIKFYNSTGLGMEGGICLPEDFEKNNMFLEDATAIDGTFQNTKIITSADCAANGFKLVTIDSLFAYIREEFPDLLFNETNPRFVIKFLYPTTLKSDINYLYYPMVVKDDVKFTKPYTFRLKTKYRYSFSGEDSITIVPSVYDYDTSSSSIPGIFWGDFVPKTETLANNYSLDSKTDELTFITNNLSVGSQIIDLNKGLTGSEKNKEFIHIFKFNNTNCDAKKLYNIKLGYNTMPNIITEVDFDNNKFNYINCSFPMYYLGHYPYVNAHELPNYIRTELNSHNISKYYKSCIDDSNSVVDCIQEILSAKSFIEIKDLNDEFILTDNDYIGVDFDNFNTVNKQIIPDNMNIIRYEDNESFAVNQLNNKDMLLMMSSPEDNLIFSYIYNSNNEDVNFKINISLLNRTSNEFKKIATRGLENMYKTIDLNKYGYSSQFIKCNDSVVMISINETISNTVTKWIVGDEDVKNNIANLPIGDYTFTRGVINVCRE